MGDPFLNLNRPWKVAAWPGMGGVAIIAQIEEAVTTRQGGAVAAEHEEAWKSGASEEPQPGRETGLSDEDNHRIESLFKLAAKDRSKAYELKAELDRLEIFRRYEDRFLELFR